MTSLNILKKHKCDNYDTPLYVWKMITDYLNLDKSAIIYDPFINTGKSKEYLNQLGYNNVIHEKENFFSNYQNKKYDILISNPPFSTKQKILKILYELDKPFILILPTSIISKLYVKNIFGDDIYKIQYIVPNRRLQFEVDGYNQKRCCFDCIFFCYKINLQRDIIYL